MKIIKSLIVVVVLLLARGIVIAQSDAGFLEVYGMTELEDCF